MFMLIPGFKILAFPGDQFGGQEPGVEGFLTNLVKWNFEKFLVRKNGNVVERDPSPTSPFQIKLFLAISLGDKNLGPEIKKFVCTIFKAEFPIFEKDNVNGPNTAPIYQFLKSSARGFLGDLVKWNFEKFLVGKKGK
ncbi:hypothetical protein RJ641_003644, partial [Dillenia turbinata]